MIIKSISNKVISAYDKNKIALIIFFVFFLFIQAHSQEIKPPPEKSTKQEVNTNNKNIELETLLAKPLEVSITKLEYLLKSSENLATKLSVLERLGQPDGAPYYQIILPSLDSKDKSIVIAALNAIGKLRNTPDKGMKEVISTLANADKEIKLASIIAIRGYEYRRVYFYAETPELMPTFALIKLLESPEEILKPEAIKTLEKINGIKQLTLNDWQEWYAKEKVVLDLLNDFEVRHKEIALKFKKSQFKEAKADFKLLEDILNKITNNYINQWTGFEKFMNKKDEDLQLLRVAINKVAPIDNN